MSFSFIEVEDSTFLDKGHFSSLPLMEDEQLESERVVSGTDKPFPFIFVLRDQTERYQR
jgi:hypothetical protein